MLPNRETLLCRYRYDPLDRLVDCTPSAQAPTRRFYLKDRLATEIQDAVQRSIMQHDDQLLAQQQRQSGAVEARLLATDQQCSVLNVLDVARPHPIAYSPYGHRPAESGLLSLLGFNGERPDPVTGCYLLGNGYRAFNPGLMRFNSPDSWSPFEVGGLNGYGYCGGDPVNRSDPTGHWGNPFKGLLNLLGRTPRRVRANRAYEAVVQTRTSPADQVGRTPIGPPPPYTAEPTARPFDGMSQHELIASPPAYSRSQTNLLPPPYSPSESLTSLGARSRSMPNLELPPPYSRELPRTARQQRIQHRINQLTDQQQRITYNTRHIPSEELGISIRETLESLSTDIRTLRNQM